MGNFNGIETKNAGRLQESRKWLPVLPVLLIILLVLTVTVSAKPAEDQLRAQINSISQTGGLISYLPIIQVGDPGLSEFPNPDEYEWVEIASGLARPVEIIAPNDGTNRLFILEQAGTIRIYESGSILNELFLDLTDRVTQDDSLGERGLLGLAFHPDYSENGFFFAYYADTDSDTVVSRFQVTSDPDIADASSETVVLTLDQPYNNHNGGHIEFGPDGYLYIGLGDGGSGGDPEDRAQDRTNLFGSILRIDVDSLPYTIPSDNPFVGAHWEGEIWDYGLRNPWKYHFDTLTGDLYIGDVGQGSWEEIDFIPSSSLGGNNFGWDYYEGSHPYEDTPPAGLELIFPIHEYATHENGTCAVTGGVVYRGGLEEWQGIYIYGDFCSGDIWGLQRDSSGNWINQSLYELDASISSFGYDQDGNIYLADLGGSIYQFQSK